MIRNLYSVSRSFLASLMYFIYLKILPDKGISVYSIDETIEALLGTDNSFVRFGDGEICLISGGGAKLFSTGK